MATLRFNPADAATASVTWGNIRYDVEFEQLRESEVNLEVDDVVSGSDPNGWVLRAPGDKHGTVHLAGRVKTATRTDTSATRAKAKAETLTPALCAGRAAAALDAAAGSGDAGWCAAMVGAAYAWMDLGRNLVKFGPMRSGTR